MTYQISATEQDMRDRWLPTLDARKMAAAAIRGLGRDIVAVVPMIQPGKEHGWWTIGQQVETLAGVILVAYTGAGQAPEGVLDYHEARTIAETLGRTRLGDREGTTGYAVVDEDGEAYVHEGIL